MKNENIINDRKNLIKLVISMIKIFFLKFNNFHLS
jgi:hypothetical protein